MSAPPGNKANGRSLDLPHPPDSPRYRTLLQEIFLFFNVYPKAMDISIVNNEM
jgi:hypothetical protein